MPYPTHGPEYHERDPWKSPCRAATTANITISTALNNADTLDGVTLATGDRVLVKNQSAGAENGIYIVGTIPSRATDFDSSVDIVGAVVLVTEGTANADTAWMCTTNATITVGTTALVFGTFGGGSTVDSGTSNPGSPSTNDIFFRTDLGLIITYDGTRWLTATVYEWMPYSAIALSASATAAIFPLTGRDIWVVDFAWTYLVNTTHSGTQYWEAKFSDSAGGSATTLTSDKATTGAFLFPAATAIGAVVAVSKAMLISITKVSTPGTILAGYRVRYRLVVT